MDQNMSKEFLDSIGIDGKGYWLFDRNGYYANVGEGINHLVFPRIIPNTKLPSILTLKRDGPRAIYKWIPYHRS